MGSTAPTGSSQGSALATTRLGIDYGALARVHSVALSAEGLTLALAPPAIAMSAQGPGQWTAVNESMPEHSRRYQAQVTGTPEGQTYRVEANGEEVDFDGFKEGILLEAKGPGYTKFIDERMDPKNFFTGTSRMVEQAERQLRVARGTPVRWIVAEEKLAAALRKLFASRDLDIEVLHIPAAPHP